MASWLSETRRPRIRAGATSAMYMGDCIEAIPTPTPPMIRATINSTKLRGTAEPMAETAKRTAENNNATFRPYRSLSTPAHEAPNMHPTRAQEAAQPVISASS